MSGAFSRLEWQIAGRYLRTRRRESFISVIAGISFIGIMLGVATLIVVMAVMTGFRADLLDRILGVNGHAIIRPLSGDFTDRDALSENLAAQPGVTFSTPLVDGQAMLSLNEAVRGVLVRGLPEGKLKQLPGIAETLEAGTLEGIDEKDGIAIGVRLAERFGFTIGDRLTLIAPRGTVTPFGTTPLVRSYEVAAIFRIGLSEYDLNFIFMSIEDASGFFGFGRQQGAIELRVDDPDAINDYRPALTQAIGDNNYLVDWKQSNSTLAGALEVERNVMFLILTMILLVAALNIVSGLVMLVRDKGRDIAVLRSMGASRGMVLRIFFITGASIGVCGTLAGVGLGTLFCAYIEEVRQFLVWLTGAELFPSEVYFLEQMPAELVAGDVMRIVTMALGLSFLSTLYPAWRAASLDPVEALRNE